MKLQAYSVYDHASETFAAPFFVPKEALALRVLTDLVNNPRTDVGQYPKDFELFHIGHYDTGSAVLTSEKPTMIKRANAMLKPENPNQLQIPGTTDNAPVRLGRPVSEARP